jgi:maltose alpha-D-glucosyltransferase/alpha-amylase
LAYRREARAGRYRHAPGIHSEPRRRLTFTLDEVTRYFDRVLSRAGEVREAPPLPPSLFDLDFAAVPPLMQELIGGFFLEMVALLGKRTGELHRALASRPQEPAFSPEPFSILYQRSVYQSMRSLARQVLVHLGRNLERLPPETRPEAQWLIASEAELLRRLGRFLDRKFAAMKIRIHGDYHLGRFLHGKDFIIIDFEGAGAGDERAADKAPSAGCGGMIRSFHYAVHAVLLHEQLQRRRPPQRVGQAWYHHVSGSSPCVLDTVPALHHSERAADLSHADAFCSKRHLRAGV